jgi:hypothetical protein
MLMNMTHWNAGVLSTHDKDVLSLVLKPLGLR